MTFELALALGVALADACGAVVVAGLLEVDGDADAESFAGLDVSGPHATSGERARSASAEIRVRVNMVRRIRTKTRRDLQPRALDR